MNKSVKKSAASKKRDLPAAASQAAISVSIPDELLAEIDGYTTDREAFVLEAIQAYLKSVSKPRKITKAISEGTSNIKTGRYEE